MTDGSVTHWIGQVKEGSESIAEREIWDHYFSRLAALARRQLRDLPPHLRDDEDVALSALHCFFTRARQNAFPEMRDRTDLWQLLARITARKAIRRRCSAYAQKRGGGRRNADLSDDLRGLAAQEPTPDVLAAMNENCQRLLGVLTPELQTVARRKLEGYTNREIAKQLGRVERTVERKLEQIRYAWQQEYDRS